MRKREQWNKLYSNEVREETVRLHEEDKWTYKQTPVTLLCELLDVWRSSYYRYIKRKQADPDGE